MCWSTLSNGNAKMNDPGLLASSAPSFVLKIVIKLKIAKNVTSTAIQGMLYICSMKEQELNEGNKPVASLIIKNSQQTEMPPPPKRPPESNFNILDIYLVVKHLLRI